jgi:hypothetical protein
MLATGKVSEATIRMPKPTKIDWCTYSKIIVFSETE